MFPAIAVYFHHPLTHTDFSGSWTNYRELFSPLSLRGTIALSTNAVENFISVGQNYFSIYTHRGLYWLLHILLHVVWVEAHCMSQWLSTSKCSKVKQRCCCCCGRAADCSIRAAGSLCSNFLLLLWDSLLTFTLAQYLKSNSACSHWQKRWVWGQNEVKRLALMQQCAYADRPKLLRFWRSPVARCSKQNAITCNRSIVSCGCDPLWLPSVDVINWTESTAICTQYDIWQPYNSHCERQYLIDRSNFPVTHTSWWVKRKII